MTDKTKETTNKEVVTEMIDPNLDIASLLEESSSTMAVSVTTDGTLYNIIDESPLATALKEKEMTQKGAVMSTTDFIADTSVSQKKDPNSVETRESEINSKISELNDMTEKAKKLHAIRQITDHIEQAAAMDELSKIIINDGVAVIPVEHKSWVENSSGNRYKKLDPTSYEVYRVSDSTKPIGIIDVVEFKTKEVTEDVIIEYVKPTFYRAQTETELTTGVIDTTSPEVISGDEGVSSEKQTLIEVVIDKTGLGGSNIEFTDDERKKLSLASEIVLKEVSEETFRTLKINKPATSFLETISEATLSTTSTPMTFPGSGFRGSMLGLTHGEMGDISVNPESEITFDMVLKKLTIIYKKLINPNIGKFESFEDFLKKFAFTDIDLAIFGLIISTLPEVDSINLECGNPECGKNYVHKYKPRTLLDMKSLDDIFLTKMKEIIDATGVEAINVANEATVRKLKMVELPSSKFILKLGIVSSYEYLYDVLPKFNDETFKEEFPDDVNGMLMLNMLMLTTVRAVLVPKGDGTYDEFTTVRDIVYALYNIKPEEFSIITGLAEKYSSVYQPQFAMVNAVCPHCGQKTEKIPLDISQLVFQKYQLMINSDVNLKNITDL